jgi:hypothetical protein
MAPETQVRDLALRLLVAAVAADRKGKAGVAARLGCSRVLLARVLSPNDACALSAKLAARVIDVYHVVRACPGTGGEQPVSECQRLAAGHAPTHNPQAMRIWKACQTCPFKPASGGKP